LRYWLDLQAVFPSSPRKYWATLAGNLAVEPVAPHANPIEIEGYTDDQAISTAEFPSNWELSAARASRVVRRLAEFGINENRMRAIGYAANLPVTSNTRVQGRLRDRRVEILILSS
jgi:chemotaxis protein MotB